MLPAVVSGAGVFSKGELKMNATLQQDIAAETYKDMLGLIKKCVWKHIYKCNIPSTEFEELFSVANLFFMQALRSYKEQKTEFSTWLYIQISLRLMQYLRDENISYYSLREEHIYAETIRSQKYCALSQNTIDMLDELGADAKNILTVFESGVLDIKKIYNQNKIKHGIKPIFRRLLRLGWTRKQILTGLRDIKNLLNTKTVYTDKEIKYEFSS